MTDDEIAAIRARHAADQERRDRNGPYYMVADDMHADRAALLAEVERLRSLIDLTAKHWLDLQTVHPIRWEGAIDNAMQAACAEVERLRAELIEQCRLHAMGSEREAKLMADAAALREALSPFAEAAGLAETSGCPPFQFCDASDYARARAVLKARGGA